MLCDIDLSEAILLVGTKKETNLVQLLDALLAYGVDCGDTHVGRTSLPTTALLRFEEGKRSHWMLWHNKRYYDPAMGIRRNIPNYLASSKMRYFLEIKGIQ